MPSPLPKAGRRSTLLSVRVHPSSRRARIEKLGPQDYKIHVTSPPEKGEANREVVEALASHLALPAWRIRIVRGEKSRYKLVAIESEDEPKKLID
jgi:uncharacterized protein (TIGR00251 family)